MVAVDKVWVLGWRDRCSLTDKSGDRTKVRTIAYQSVYRAVIADRMTDAPTETVTIAGKHCESGNFEELRLLVMHVMHRQ